MSDGPGFQWVSSRSPGPPTDAKAQIRAAIAYIRSRYPAGSPPCTRDAPCPYAEGRASDALWWRTGPMPYLSARVQPEDYTGPVPRGEGANTTMWAGAHTHRITPDLHAMGRYIEDWANHEAERREGEAMRLALASLPWPLRWLVAYPRALGAYWRLRPSRRPSV